MEIPFSRDFHSRRQISEKFKDAKNLSKSLEAVKKCAQRFALMFLVEMMMKFRAFKVSDSGTTVDQVKHFHFHSKNIFHFLAFLVVRP